MSRRKLKSLVFMLSTHSVVRVLGINLRPGIDRRHGRERPQATSLAQCTSNTIKTWHPENTFRSNSMKKIIASSLAVVALSLVSTAFLAQDAQARGLRGLARAVAHKTVAKRIGHRRCLRLHR